MVYCSCRVVRHIIVFLGVWGLVQSGSRCPPRPLLHPRPGFNLTLVDKKHREVLAVHDKAACALAHRVLPGKHFAGCLPSSTDPVCLSVCPKGSHASPPPPPHHTPQPTALLKPVCACCVGSRWWTHLLTSPCASGTAMQRPGPSRASMCSPWILEQR